MAGEWRPDEFERLGEMYGIGVAIAAVATLIVVLIRSLGEFAGSVPCKRISFMGTNQWIKVHRRGARRAGVPRVYVRITGPGIFGWVDCALVPDEALLLADYLDEAARKAGPR